MHTNSVPKTGPGPGMPERAFDARSAQSLPAAAGEPTVLGDPHTCDSGPAGAGERRAGVERRSDIDRRSNLDRRRGPGRRRTDYRRAAEEGHMNEEQLDFLRAVDEYKRVNDRAFPSLTEILDLLLYLGYRRVAPVGEFKLCKGRQTPPRGQAPC